MSADPRAAQIRELQRAIDARKPALATIDSNTIDAIRRVGALAHDLALVSADDLARELHDFGDHCDEIADTLRARADADKYAPICAACDDTGIGYSGPESVCQSCRPLTWVPTEPEDDPRSER